MRENREMERDVLSPESQPALGHMVFDTMIELGLLPGRAALAGVRHARQILEREHEDPEELLNQKYSTFEEFMASDDGVYQDVFDTHTKQGSAVFQAFTEKVHEHHGIEITEPDDSDSAEIPMLNGHRLEIHRQNSGSYFLIGSHSENQSN